MVSIFIVQSTRQFTRTLCGILFFRPLLTFDNKISKPVEVNGQTVKEHSDIMKTIANKNSCFWYIVGGEGFFTVFKNTNAFFDDSIPCFILGSWF